MKSADVHGVLGRLKGYSGTYIKEFTWWTETVDVENREIAPTNLRIDGLLLDIENRKAHGYEIKLDLWDWHRDKKWQLYAAFCSTLSVACPEGMIDDTELPPGYGLLWINKNMGTTWVRRPKPIKHDPAAWAATYLKILENEFPRMQAEIRALKAKKYAAKAVPAVCALLAAAALLQGCAATPRHRTPGPDEAWARALDLPRVPEK